MRNGRKEERVIPYSPFPPSCTSLMYAIIKQKEIPVK
jgi:hypothetical protein